MPLAALAATLVLAGSVSAQEQPVVRVEVAPETVAVGESVQMRVTVLVPTWFVRPPVYPSFELANAITRLPPDSSFPTSERVGRDTWSGIVRNYRVYPLLGASYRLAGQTIRIAYANPGVDPIVADVDVPAVEFRGAVPDGAETLDPYIAGRSLTLALNADGPIDELTAGDALVLEYVAEIDGLPAIFLPSLAPALDFDGVSVYADEPRVQDGTPARRSERLTLVFEAGGEFTIPDLRLRYWNTEAASVETVTAAGFPVSVAGNPVAPIETGAAPLRPWWQMVLVLAALAVFLLVLWRVVTRLAGRYRTAKERQKQTEAYAFRRLRNALRARDGEAAYQVMLAWLSRLAPDSDTRGFAGEFGDESLRQHVDALSAGLYTGGTDVPNFRELEQGLAAARARYLENAMRASHSALPPLNP
jgi:hypothetical protein